VQVEAAKRHIEPIPLIHQIGTRDGTLSKDAKMVNCFSEKTELGTAAVKRPGTSLVQQNPVATGQGQLLVNDNPYAISGDIIYRTGTSDTYAIPAVTIPNQQYQILSDVPKGTTLLKSASGLWKFDGTTVTKITDVNYPATTVFGIAYLDGGYYVMDATGTVRGSAFQDPTTWPVLNYITGDTSLSVGTGITRHLNYICAFYDNGLQLFYDAGTSPGSPLAAVSNASWGIGTPNGNSIAKLGDETYFISNARQRGRTVTLLTGLSLNTVSNPYIERTLNASNLFEVHAFGLKVAGHSFYILTLVDLNLTLVYDTTYQHWSTWSSLVGGFEQYFSSFNYINGNSNTDLLQERSTGAILTILPSTYSDVSGGIPVFIRTPPYDWGTLAIKFIPALHLLADTIATTVSIRYSDNDYGSFSAYRTILLSTVRKMLQRCGSSRRRSWDILHNDTTPLRLYGMEITPEISAEKASQ
jgi:hypothetical protein